MNIVLVICTLAAVVGVSLCTVFAYRKGISDGRAIQAIREFLPYELKKRGGGKI